MVALHVLCFMGHLINVLGIFSLHAVLEAEGVPAFLVDIENSARYPFSSTFCDDYGSLFVHQPLIDKCKEVLVPMIRDVDSPAYYTDANGADIPLFIIVTDKSKLEEVQLANRVTYAVSYMDENPSQPLDHIAIISLASDSSSSRQLLVNSIQYRYIGVGGSVDKVVPNIVPLMHYIAPEMEKDFNVDLHFGTKFIDALDRATTDNETFHKFKSQSDLIENPASLAISTYAVFFAVWYSEEKYAAVAMATWRLRSSNPSMYAYLDELSRVENIGAPSLTRVAGAAQSPDEPTPPPFVLPVTPVLLRYLLEASQLDDYIGRPGLENKHILEIGGGYGGFAVALQSIYRLRRYCIVDLAEAGRLQQRYVREVNTMFNRNISVETIPSTNTEPVASDVVISFFAISELRRDVVDRYMKTYIAGAPRGFLQLNFDDEDVATMASADRTRTLYSAIDMFKLVYQLHPTAVLLPPPDYHTHHRIMWKPSGVHSRSDKTAAIFVDGDSGGDCDCRKFAGEYLEKMGKQLQERCYDSVQS